MRKSLPSSLPLICPACATRSERGLELSSLEVESASEQAGDELIEGVLRCTGCARRYPLIDGIPAVWRELGDAPPSLLHRRLSPEVTGLLAEVGSDEAPVAQDAALLGSYLDSSWGDCATPPPETPFGYARLVEKLVAAARRPARRVVELGCGVGRGLAHLAGAELSIGLDQSPTALRCARTILSGAPLPFARRISGRAYAPASICSPGIGRTGVELICADALRPPLAPASFDRVVALNLLDTVRSPRELLDVLAGLVAPGGELILCAPYAWKSGVTAEGERLGGADPAAAVRGELAARGLAIEEEDLHVPWSLRRDSRAASLYDVHWLRARRPG